MPPSIEPPARLATCRAALSVSEPEYARRPRAPPVRILSSMRRILAYSDLTERSDAALLRAARLAQRQGAELVILHATDGDEAAAHEALAAGLADLPLECPAALHVVRGRPFVEIIRASRSLDAGLVVVGALAESAVRGFVLGSTAERLIRKGDRPVLVVKNPTWRLWRRVLVASDCSETSLRAARLALSLRPDAQMTLLHVVEPQPEARLRRFGATEPELRDLREEALQAGRQALDRFRAQLPPEARIDLLVQQGSAVNTIPDVARELRVGLVALGTHGRSGASHMLLGSVAESVVREAPCDTLTVRPDAFRFELP